MVLWVVGYMFLIAAILLNAYFLEVLSLTVQRQTQLLERIESRLSQWAQPGGGRGDSLI